MKTLILFSLVTFSLAALADCKKPVDPKKVILFIDTNFSDLEIATTEKAACDRGERVVIIPKNQKDYTKYIEATEAANKVFQKCARKMDQPCDKERDFVSSKINELEAFKAKQKNIPDATREVLEELKNSGAKLKNITISGHDGGGHFGGSKGDFGRHDLAEVMKDYEEINDVSSILLLGCYTGVQNEIYAWKNIFPNVKIIAGYDGSAPLSDKPLGHQYIRDILLKENAMLKIADEKKLQSYMKQNIQSMTQMYSALYLQCSDGSKEGEFYYSSENKAEGFKKMDIAECQSKKPEMEEIEATFGKYNSGELEIPKDTTNGALRQLYNRARRNEHCTEITNIDLDVNGIFNLLFYAGVKDNFTNFYKDDLKKAEEIMSKFDMNDFKTKFEAFLQGQEKHIEELKADIVLMEDPAAYIAKQQKSIQVKEQELNKLLADPAYAKAVNSVRGRSKEDEAKAIQVNDLKYDIEKMKYSHEVSKKDISYSISQKKRQIQNFEQNITANKLAFDKIQSQGQKIWVPTKENFKTKSRKETLQNMSNIHGFLSLPGLDYKVRQTMKWLLNAQSTHLQYLQNPFSWHEFTGQTEVPEEQYRLNDYVREE